MPQQALALVQRSTSNGAQNLSLEPLPIPQPGNHQLLVKISHVAQNPTDVQSFDSNAFGDGAVLGCDFVGEVAQIGEGVVRATKGDVIAGLIWGGEVKGLGAYGQYVLADDRISFEVPASISRAEAATLPLGITTAWLAFFSEGCLDIPRDSEGDLEILVWGGSSSVGQYAIQIAALHRFKIITTCSPRHFDKMKALGAQHVFDYRDPDVISSIKTAVPNLQYVFDTIGNSDSSSTASQGICEAGGTLCTVRPGKAHTSNVTQRTKVTDVLVWTAFLKDHRYGEFFWPANEADHELACELFSKLPEWIEKGNIKPNEAKVRRGLEAVAEGFQELREGRISGYKIVYEIEGQKLAS